MSQERYNKPAPKHSTFVVTWQAPGGGRIDICTNCEARLLREGDWPKNSMGREYCDVSRGAHRGDCQLRGG